MAFGIKAYVENVEIVDGDNPIRQIAVASGYAGAGTHFLPVPNGVVGRWFFVNSLPTSSADLIWAITEVKRVSGGFDLTVKQMSPALNMFSDTMVIYEADI